MKLVDFVSPANIKPNEAVTECCAPNFALMSLMYYDFQSRYEYIFVRLKKKKVCSRYKTKSNPT